MAVPFSQEILLFGVVLHQLSQRGELLASVQVVVVTWVLDLNMGHLIVTPEWGEKKPDGEFSQLFFMWVNRGGLTPDSQEGFFYLVPCINFNTEHTDTRTNGHPHTCPYSMRSHKQNQDHAHFFTHAHSDYKCIYAIKKCPAHQAICSHCKTEAHWEICRCTDIISFVSCSALIYLILSD